jgi:hypothetical protein
MNGHARLPKDDYTVVENYFFDHIMPRVSPAEWKVICAVIRETVGWRCDVIFSPPRMPAIGGRDFHRAIHGANWLR